MISWSIALSQWQTIGLVIDYSIKILAIGFVPEGRRPSSSTAWLLAILLLPYVGLPLFLLMGSPYINRRRHRVQQRANETITDVHAGEPDYPPGTLTDRDIISLIKLNRKLTSMPAVFGMNHGIHSDYEATIKAMAEAVDSAEDYVHCEIYIVAWDETTDVFFRSLEAAVKRGVDVRLLFDQVGSWKYPGYRKLGKRLTEIGVHWHLMLPLQPWRWRFRRPDLRNHRKMLIIDGERAFVGSQNLIDSSYLLRGNRKAGRHWVDIMVELTGPIVSSLNMVFAVDWLLESDELVPLKLAPSPLGLPDRDRDSDNTDATIAFSIDKSAAEQIPATVQIAAASQSAQWSGTNAAATLSAQAAMVALDSPYTPGAMAKRAQADPRTNIVQLVPSGPGYTTEPNLRMFNAIIHHATTRLVMCSPYFIPDESMLEAVTSAAFRGVDVELYVSEQGDQFSVHHAQSSYYQALLEAGVRIFLYRAPAVLHSKYIIADPHHGAEAVCALGSSNMDMRSFGLNYEISVVATSGNLVSDLDALTSEYRANSIELTLEKWNERGFGRRYIDNVMRLTSALQ